MLIKIIICALLLFIVINLVRAGVAMLRQQDSTLPMSHFLGRRVLYSAVIFSCSFGPATMRPSRT